MLIDEMMNEHHGDHGSAEYDRSASADVVRDVLIAARDRASAEAGRMAAIRAAGDIPAECGPDIAPSPARGGFVLAPQVAMVPNGVDEYGLDRWAPAAAGYGHRSAIRCADAFDAMMAAALRRKKPMALTPGQVAIGRRYHDLVEFLSAGGVALSSMEGRTGGGGDSGNWMDHRLQVSDEVTRLQHRIGTGVALAVRRVRPSDRGTGQRGPITDRRLVDMVCLEGRSLDEVLKVHGWAKDAKVRKAVTEALCAALDRMIGYRVKNRC